MVSSATRMQKGDRVLIGSGGRSLHMSRTMFDRAANLTGGEVQEKNLRTIRALTGRNPNATKESAFSHSARARALTGGLSRAPPSDSRAALLGSFRPVQSRGNGNPWLFLAMSRVVPASRMNGRSEFAAPKRLVAFPPNCALIAAIHRLHRGRCEPFESETADSQASKVVSQTNER